MVASSFAQQGIPMSSYGQEIATRYREFVANPDQAGTPIALGPQPAEQIPWIEIFGEATIRQADGTSVSFPFMQLGITEAGRVVFSPADGLGYMVHRGEQLIRLELS
jgi:hypothetical protein